VRKSPKKKKAAGKQAAQIETDFPEAISEAG
jgi:hypothetical protein